jgi:hypothetical protein
MVTARLVALFFTVTATPGNTALLGSFTTPATLPNRSWANAGRTRTHRIAERINKVRIRFEYIPPPLELSATTGALERDQVLNIEDPASPHLAVQLQRPLPGGIDQIV